MAKWWRCVCCGGGMCCGRGVPGESGGPAAKAPSLDHQEVGEQSRDSDRTAARAPALDANDPSEQPRESNVNASTSAPLDVQHLKEILKEIDEAIETAEKRSDPKPPIEKSTPSNSYETKTEHLLDTVLEAFRKLKPDEAVQVKIKAVAKESYMTLRDTVEALGNVHWVATGLLMVSYVLKRVDTVATNYDDCLHLLKNLSLLGHHMVKLIPEIQDEDESFARATSLIAIGAIFCCSHLESKKLKRFAFAVVKKEDLSSLEKEIKALYPNLNLAVETATIQRLPLLPQSRVEPGDGIVGLQKKVEKILQELEIVEEEVQPEVKSIVLYGMGGIGKSTLANEVASKLSDKKMGFSYGKVEIGENPSDKKIVECQTAILDRLSGQKWSIAECDEGRTTLKDFFRNRSEPVLLFVDNVLKTGDLEKLLPNKLKLPNKSRLIFTTRDSRVSWIVEERVEGHCKTYPVPPLKDPEDKELLCTEVFKENTHPAEKEEAVKSVLERCGGLPLALKLVGRYLKHNNTESGWGFVIKNLSNLDSVDGNEEDLLNKAIYFCYDQIDLSHKNAFIDIACMLRKRKWDWAECAFEYGSQILEKLEQVGLVGKAYYRQYYPLYLSEEQGEETIEIHDLLVALAWKESSTNSKHLSCNDGDDIPDDPGPCGVLEGLCLTEVFRPDPLLSEPFVRPIQAQKLDAMFRSLRILIIDGVRLEGKCSQIPSNLQFFYSDSGIPFKDIVRLHKLKVLIVSSGVFENGELPGGLKMLDLRHCRFESLLITTIGKLHSLQILKMWSCEDLKKPDVDFSGLSSLREVNLSHCDQLQCLPTQFGKLVALESLNLTGCKSLTVFPDDFSGLSSLEELELSHCDQLQCLPTQFGKLVALRTLDLGNCRSLTVLPEDFSGLSSLEKLILSNCQQLQCLPIQFGKLVALKTLDLRGCKSLTALQDDFSGLTSLEVLGLSRCDQLQCLPTQFGKLVALRTLDLGDCKSLTVLPEDFSGLSRLEVLKLSYCDRLQCLPAQFGKLVALKALDLGGCRSLMVLPEDFSGLSSLRRVNLIGCERLQSLPTQFGLLVDLKTLNLRGCQSLTVLPDDFSGLSSLELLDLGNCDQLQCLPAQLGKLVTLETLDLGGCRSLRVLPDDFSGLSSLRRVNLIGCERLQSLPTQFGLLVDLKTLNLRGCQSLTVLPDDFSGLSSLELLELSNCDQLQCLPAQFGKLVTLKTLNLGGCKSLTVLPEDFSGLPSLKEVNLSGCERLQSLPTQFGKLVDLKTLNLGGCKSLTVLPDDFSGLSSLEVLKLSNCDQLQCLPAQFGKLVAPKTLDLGGCKSLRYFQRTFQGFLH